MNKTNMGKPKNRSPKIICSLDLFGYFFVSRQKSDGAGATPRNIQRSSSHPFL